MAKVWLTQHLDARYGNHTEEILLCNLAYGTRILAQPDSWQKLEGYQQPTEAEDDPWIQRAIGAKILVGDEPDHPDFVLRLESQMRRYLTEWEGGEPDDAGDAAGLLAMLGRVENHYRQHHMPSPYTGTSPVGPLMVKPSRLADFMFDHIRAFLAHDLENDRRTVDLGLVQKFFARPAMKLRYEQQFCIPRTTQDRAQKIAENLKPGQRVLVLGDDDLVSLALAELDLEGVEIDVLELDADLVAFLKEKGEGRYQVLEYNLRHGVPDSMREAYDLVTTDPPYAADGMRFFLQCARDSLKKSASSRLFLSTFPGLIESPERLWADLEDLGLTIEQKWEHFSRYIYNNSYRVDHLACLKHLGSPLHPTSELIGFPYLYAHFFECSNGG